MAAAPQTQSQIIPKLIFKPLPTYPTQLNGTPPSHDISSAGYHVTQKALLLQLDHAVKASWTSRHQSKYADVKVLLLSWESDDLGVEKEISILESVFKDAYHFEDVQQWKIPDKRPGHEASARIAKFLEAGGFADNLLIVYYAGHAMPNVNHRGLPTWFANRQPSSPKFNSSMIQDYLCEVDDASPDVLFLYDTCHSANGHGSVESSRSAIALLAACGFESVAAEIGPHSFTYALIQELSEAARQQKAVSVPQLHSSLLNRLHLQRQEVLLQKRDGKICIRTTNDGIPLFEHPVWRTPIYIQLSQNTRPRPIMLAPLPKKSILTIEPDFIVLNAQPASNDTCGIPEQRLPEQRRMHVLLRVSLAEDSFNIEEFKDWICEAPEPAKEIKIIHTMPSCSTLLLLQMPVELWDMLPASPAISFVGFVSVDEPNGSPGNTLATTMPPVESSAKDSVVPTHTAATGLAISPPQEVKKGVSFDSSTDDTKSIVAILDYVDSILPTLFREIRQAPVQDDSVSETRIVPHVMNKLLQTAKLPTGDFGPEAVSLRKNVELVNDYICAKWLLEHDNPLLNLTWRLNPLFSWRNYDAEIPDDQATILTDADSIRSDPRLALSIFSEARTVDTSLTSISSISYASRNVQAARQPSGGNTDHSRDFKGNPQKKTRGRPVHPDADCDDGLSRSWSHSPGRAESPPFFVAKTSVDPTAEADPVDTIEDKMVTDANFKSSSRPRPPRHPYSDTGEVQGKSLSGRTPEAYEQPLPLSTVDYADKEARSSESFQMPVIQNDEFDGGLAAPDAHELGLDYLDPHEFDTPPAYASSRGFQSGKIINNRPERTEQGYYVRKTHWSSLPADQAGVEVDEFADATTAGRRGLYEEIDPRYKVESSYKFKPGQVLKILWSESQGQSSKSDRVGAETFTGMTSTGNEFGERFYVGFRRFIIVASDQSHSTCVPILTYVKQGCSKRGVNPLKHGIVYDEHEKPRLLKGEPALGFPPVRMTFTASGEKLAKESRVNYSKLVTIEHNTKLFFIGHIADKDFVDIVMEAVDKCWSEMVRFPVNSTGARRGH